ncbi:MAG: hypothetical protein ACLQOO_26395 [Terriglobia bacterium]
MDHAISGITALFLFACMLLAAAFMIYALAKFHGELKTPKRTRQLPCESDRGQLRVLIRLARGTFSPAEPANKPELIVTVEPPNLGPISLLAPALSAGTKPREMERSIAPLCLSQGEKTG